MSFSTSIKQPGCSKRRKIPRVLFIYHSFRESEMFQMPNVTIRDDVLPKKFSCVLFTSAAGRYF